MKTKSIFTMAVVLVALSALPALAQKGKGGYFGQLFAREVYALEPGIEVVLMLTEAQQTKLTEAVTSTIQSPTLAELAPKLKKGDAGAQEAFEKYNAARVKAEADLKELVQGILTAEQKATIKKIDDTVKGAVEGALSAEQKETLAKSRIKQKK